jgi:hypothetical protein
MHPANLLLGILYLGHWFLVIPYTTLRMALLPKRWSGPRPSTSARIRPRPEAPVRPREATPPPSGGVGSADLLKRAVEVHHFAVEELGQLRVFSSRWTLASTMVGRCWGRRPRLIGPWRGCRLHRPVLAGAWAVAGAWVGRVVGLMAQGVPQGLEGAGAGARGAGWRAGGAGSPAVSWWGRAGAAGRPRPPGSAGGLPPSAG